MSVVIPTYNRADRVARAVASVLRQTVHDLELIVVDDGSPDHTRAAVAAVGDERLRYVRHEVNRGRCAARNAGIRAARGRYLAFLDDDDEWMPDKLQKQLDIMRSSPLSPGVVLCGLRYADEADDPAPLTMHRGQVFDAILHRKLLVSVVTILVDTTKTGEVFFDERSGEAGEEFGYALHLASRTEFDYVPERLVRVHRNLARDPRDGIAGRLRVLENFEPTFVQHPKALARHCYELALEYLRLKERGLAWSFLWKAIRSNPRDYRPWAALTCMALGASDVAFLEDLRKKLARR